ncbi:hypothetical protein PILCRDRAFT_92806 [Piloderma croceum F 1598]|uniref:Uncharacterized protein n=1 Tax=Piloderma croceum (strain F 1598) TaxID=765440 RepID=A0A0C3F1Y0_PILCF|nr:hypothetical protein PILCRDRAFT_92806 [Piloderma croceum F 1598]
MLKVSLDHGATISDSVFDSAAHMSSGGEALLKELEDLVGTRIECTEDLLVAAASNSDSQLLILREAADHPDGYKRLMLLLDKQGDLEITSKMLKESGYWPEMLQLLLERGGRTKVMEEVLLATARHWNCNEPVPVLLSAGENVNYVMITEEVLVAVMGNLDYGNAVQSIIDRTSPVDLTNKVLEAAAGNRKNAKEMIQMLFDRLGKARITEGVVKAAVGNFGSGMHLLALFEEQVFLRRSGSEVVTDEVLKAVIDNNESAASGTLAEIFRRGYQKKIPEQVAISAAACEFQAIHIMKVLLEQGVDIEITEEVVKTAAENEECREELLKMLLERCAEENIPLSVDYRVEDK